LFSQLFPRLVAGGQAAQVALALGEAVSRRESIRFDLESEYRGQLRPQSGENGK
jgi:hypothetical protein